jgi:hypothetical protein
LFRSFLQGLEARIPQLVENCAHRGESFEVNAVETSLSVDPDMHESDLSKEFEMLARGRRGETRRLCEFGGGALVVTSAAQHRAAAGMSHRPYCLVE